MTRKEVIGNATLYLGDCLEILPTLEKVDAVITDPPYGIENGSAFAEGGLKNVKDVSGVWNTGIIEWINSCQLLAGANLAYFHARGGEPACKYKVWHRFYWVKQNPPPNPRNVFCSGVEECTIASAPGKRYWGGGGSTPNYFISPLLTERNGHPAEKPVALMGILIKCLSAVAASVLDPFMGSGTTGVACMNLGRRFIGIEIEERYFQIACERIEAAQKQGRLFEDGGSGGGRPEPTLLPGM